MINKQEFDAIQQRFMEYDNVAYTNYFIPSGGGVEDRIVKWATADMGLLIGMIETLLTENEALKGSPIEVQP